MKFTEPTMDKSTRPNRHTEHLTTAEYIFSLGAHETFSKTDHMSGHKTNLKELRSYKVCSVTKMEQQKSVTERNLGN